MYALDDDQRAGVAPVVHREVKVCDTLHAIVNVNVSLSAVCVTHATISAGKPWARFGPELLSVLKSDPQSIGHQAMKLTNIEAILPWYVMERTPQMISTKNLGHLSKRNHLLSKPLKRLMFLAVTLLVLPLVGALLMQKPVFADAPFNS